MQQQDTEEQGVVTPLSREFVGFRKFLSKIFNVGGKYCLPDLAISHDSKM